jgi:anthranilate synthase component I
MRLSCFQLQQIDHDGPPMTLHPALPEFLSHCRQYNVVAVWAELVADYETPLSAFRKLAQPGEASFLFESAEITSASGRYSFLGTQPREMFVRSCSPGFDPLRELETKMKAFRPAPAPGLPVFHGGAVGFLAYDVVRSFEPTVPPPPPDTLELPDVAFMIADTIVIFDHKVRTMQIVANVCTDDFPSPEAAYAAARQTIAGIIRRLEQPRHFKPLSIGTVPPLEPQSNMTQDEYESAVRQGQEYIKAGDIFQFVPSQRFSVPFDGDPVDLYRALRHVNPSPYMFCLQFPEGYALVGSSPEVHVRCLEGKVEIRPIAGTRPRGADEAGDQAYEKELLADPKECAEHLMLVDLARNDVGRAAEFGSVKVTDLMIIERYSHVMHIVSHVEGRLKPGCSTYDVMAATFPAGTVSGSPKVRAMQIINELEKNKRCAYAGAVGYFGFDGNLDSCIALRTCVLKDSMAYVQAGAGVVADSDPTAEYLETVNKAKGMIRAIARAKTLAE